MTQNIFDTPVVQPDSLGGRGKNGAVSIHDVFALWNNHT